MVCMIRVDTAGQQSVCLRSGCCHWRSQEAGQWLPEMEWTLKVLTQVKLHKSYKEYLLDSALFHCLLKAFQKLGFR